MTTPPNPPAESAIEAAPALPARKPEWLKVRMPGGCLLAGGGWSAAPLSLRSLSEKAQSVIEGDGIRVLVLRDARIHLTIRYVGAVATVEELQGFPGLGMDPKLPEYCRSGLPSEEFQRLLQSDGKELIGILETPEDTGSLNVRTVSSKPCSHRLAGFGIIPDGAREGEKLQSIRKVHRRRLLPCGET
jgi:hypothetical protein